MEATTNVNEETPAQPKLDLIKNPAKFKMSVPQNVEMKIRLLCAKYEHLEWSGVLFYTYKGSFENGDLFIICKDILLMDIGSGAYTEWCADADVISYMCENDLMDCQMGIIHSHNTMATFFSGTDTNTLRDEGTDRNNLVSLIVNNDGTYSAAITRHNKVKSFVKEEGTYEFFGEGERHFTDEYETEDSYIEYFMFDVVRKAPKGILGFLERIKEVVRKPKPSNYGRSNNWNGGSYGGRTSPYGGGYGGYQAPKSTVPATVKPATTQLPAPHASAPVQTPAAKPTVSQTKPASVPKDSYVNQFWDCTPIDLGDKKVDPFIETLVIQLITGNLFAKASKDFDLDKWVADNMFKVYKERFGTETDAKSEFGSYVDNILEYMLYSVDCADLEGYSSNDRSELIASLMGERVESIPSRNVYLNSILKSLQFHYD